MKVLFIIIYKGVITITAKWVKDLVEGLKADDEILSPKKEGMWSWQIL